MSVGQPIECNAAVAYAPNKPLTIEKIIVEAPKVDEIRVKVLKSALCHTDAFTLSGEDNEWPASDFKPVILGHEAVGVIESVGPEVTDLSIGDHVIMLYTAECGECKFCIDNRTNLCIKVRSTQGKGVMPDGTTRFKNLKGEPIYHFMGCSAFSEYTVVSKHSAVKINKEFNLEQAALLGCGVATGFGAAGYKGIGAAKKGNQITKGSSVAVFGLGAVGCSVLEGAKAAGAKKIIAIDTNDNKEAWAKEFGATDFVNPLKLKEGENIVSKLVSMSDDGFGIDFTYDCTGNVNVMNDALMASARGTGISTVIGVAPAGAQISVRPFYLIVGRTWTGIAYGNIKGKSEMTELIQASDSGDLSLDKYVTHRREFTDINTAFEDLHSGDCLRTVFNY
ncbi:hypothetical protein QEN19_003271 [Hanseniaspora menglaensis]